MKATLIAWTAFNASTAKALTGWETDVADGEALVEFAGRACYQSWEKPNPETATNEGYLANIIKQEHFSVLEHANITFYITGVSRSLTHELIRHRHFSYSELSQRFVNVEDAAFVLAPALENEDQAQTMQELATVGYHMKQAYKTLVTRLEARGKPRKQAREAARCVMPNMTETRIVMTGNIRAWREFLAKRGTEHADAEIRRLAVEIGDQLQLQFPNFFQDMRFLKRDDDDTLYFA